MTMLKRLLSTMALLVLAACGGGGGDAGTPPFGGGGSGGGDSGGGGGGGGITAPTVTMELQLLDGAGNQTSSILAGQPVRAQATLLRNGSAVGNEIVLFTAEQSGGLVQIVDPATGSQLTNASGVAVAQVTSLANASGAGRIRAAATVGGVAATATATFFASGGTTSQPPTLTLGTVLIDTSTVSAYGTTGLRVQVLQGSSAYTSGPVVVNFTTECPAGRAAITGSATTRPDGIAEATFEDRGCAQVADRDVRITASIASASAVGTVRVLAPTTGSLRFVGVQPSDKSITLRGQGGFGRQENATLTFQLVDVAGQGVGNADVCFDATTYVGELNIDGFRPGVLPSAQGSAALCGSDSLSVVKYVKRTNPDGTVNIQVNSGNIPTPVRVRARTLYPVGNTVALVSFSDTLSISTGLPLQRSFSLSIDKANIDGGNFDGEVANLTIRLADQFSNPVPDGTVVNFIASGGAVCTADNGSCRTLNGACSCAFTSQARRPMDNRVVVTAYAVGLEDYDETGGDNVYTEGDDRFNVDPTRRPQDLGNAYVDANKDGLPGDGITPSGGTNPTKNGDTDILIPFRLPTDIGDTLFNRDGDGKRGLIHLRSSSIVYLSLSSSGGDPTVVVPLSDLSEERSLSTGALVGGYFVRLKPFCPQGTPVPQASLAAFLDDGIGNPMAAGTALAAADVADNLATGGFIPGAVQALGARPPIPLIDEKNLPKDLPWTTADPRGNVPTGHAITVRGVTDKCAGDANFALQVTSPRGGAAVARVLFENEARTTSRSRFPVRYRENVNFEASARAGRVVALTQPTLAVSVGSVSASGYRIEWGDGTTSSGVGATIAPADLTKTYPVAVAGTSVSITMFVTVAGVEYQTTRTAVVLP